MIWGAFMFNVRCQCAVTLRSLTLAINNEIFYITVINAPFSKMNWIPPVISLHLRFWNQIQMPPPLTEVRVSGWLARRFESTMLSRNVGHQLPSDAVPCPSRTETSSAPSRKPKTHRSKEFSHQTCFPRVFVWPFTNPLKTNPSSLQSIKYV